MVEHPSIFTFIFRGSFGHRRLVPFSNGVEDYEATLEDAVACVGSNCQKPILEEEEGESVPRSI